MTGSQDSPTERKVSIATLEKQLIDLRTRGLNNPTVSDLTELLRLATELVPDAALEVGVDEEARYWEDNDDPDVRRIEVLLECSLDVEGTEGWLNGSLNAQAVRLWFGLDPKTRKLGQNERHEEARLALGRPIASGTWRNSYATKIKKELTTRLRTRFKAGKPFALDQAVRSVPKDVSPPEEEDGSAANNEPEKDSTGPRAWPETRRSRLRFLIPAAVTAAAVVLAIVFGVFSTSGKKEKPRSSIPPKGTIINATTGEVDPQPDRRPPRGEIRLIGGGPIFRGCNLTREAECNFREGQFHVALGDRVKFVFVLQNEGKTPLPYARFSVNIQNGFDLKPNEARANFFISWPGSSNEAKNLTEMNGHITFLSGGEPISVRYIPGSTELLPLNPQHRLTYLPDGVVSLYGIGLTHIGAPPSCFINCVGRFIRFIEFEAEIVR